MLDLSWQEKRIWRNGESRNSFFSHNSQYSCLNSCGSPVNSINIYCDVVTNTYSSESRAATHLTLRRSCKFTPTRLKSPNFSSKTEAKSVFCNFKEIDKKA